VVDFNVSGEHDRLRVTAAGRGRDEGAPGAAAGGWERARGEEYTGTGGEFLLPTDDEPTNGTLNQLIEDVRGSDPRSTLQTLCELIPDRFEYNPGVTFVGSTVDDLLEAGGGRVPGLRAPVADPAAAARDRRAVRLRLPVRGAGGRRHRLGGGRHARLDRGAPAVRERRRSRVGGRRPTNRTLAGETHVKIGHGRFYGDVPPIKGVYRGAGGEAEHDVSVKMTRLD
jgi:hypothetical protein